MASRSKTNLLSKCVSAINLLEAIAHKGHDYLKKFQTEVRLMKKKYLGEPIAVIGPKASGKSTFLKYLQNQNISDQDLKTYRATEKDDYKGFKCKWTIPITETLDEEFIFLVQKSSDVGGEKYLRDEHWLPLIEKSRVILFIIDGERVIKKNDLEYKASLIEDLVWIWERANHLKKNSRIIPVINKIDLMCDYGKSYDDFSIENKDNLEELFNLARNQWPKAYRKKITNYVLCSLIHKTMRVDAVLEIIKQIMGDEILNALKKNE